MVSCSQPVTAPVSQPLAEVLLTVHDIRGCVVEFGFGAAAWELWGWLMTFPAFFRTGCRKRQGQDTQGADVAACLA